VHCPPPRTVLCLSLVVVAALLRFSGLEQQSLWNDEMFSLDVAGSEPAEILPKLIDHYRPPPLFF
jgi:hypothetical protein